MGIVVAWGATLFAAAAIVAPSTVAAKAKIEGKRTEVRSVDVAGSLGPRAVVSYVARGRKASSNKRGSGRRRRPAVYTAEVGGSSRSFRHTRRRVPGSNGAVQAKAVATKSGRSAVAWIDRENRLLVADSRVTGRWSKPREVVSPSKKSKLSGYFRFDFDMATDGSLLVAWHTAGELSFRTSAGARPLTAPQVLDSSLATGFPPRVKVSEDGEHRSILWAGTCSQGGPFDPSQIAFIESNGIVTAQHSINDSECPTAGVDLSLEADGRAFALMNGRSLPSGEALFENRAATGTSAAFGSARQISPQSEKVNAGQAAAFGGDSPFTVIWSTGFRARDKLFLWRRGEQSNDSVERIANIRAWDFRFDACAGCRQGAMLWQEPTNKHRLLVRPVDHDGGIGPSHRVSGRLSSRAFALYDLAVGGSPESALVAWSSPGRRGFEGLRVRRIRLN